MSVIAKILIVLNLLLAVGFLGASATFLGQQESWKIKHDKLETAKNAEIQQLNASLTTERDRAKAQEREAQAKNSELQALTGRFEESETNYAQMQERYAALLGQYERLSQTYQEAIKNIEDLTKQKDNLINEKDQALSEKRDANDAMNSARTDLKQVQGELETAQANAAELEKRITAMADQLESTEILVEAYREKFGELAAVMNPPTIHAKVSGVNNELNIVLLTVGRDDQVKVGYSFTVYRGNDYVGKVIIDKVEKDFASGYSVKELEKGTIQVGDSATTRF